MKSLPTLMIVLGALLCLVLPGNSSVLGSSSSILSDQFTEPFDSIGNWTLFGDSTPRWRASILGRTGVFDNNGDSASNSGGISKSSFDISAGFTITSDVYVEFTDTMSCWSTAGIGIADPTIHSGEYLPYISLRLQVEGDSCSELDPSLRHHAYFYGSYATATGSEPFFPTPGNPTLFRADSYVNHWDTLKIVVDSSKKPRFYVGSHLIYTGTADLDTNVTKVDRPLWIGSRSSGRAGKAYHDNIALTTCDLPGVPLQQLPENGEAGAPLTVTVDWNGVTGATKYQMLVDTDSTFGSPDIDQQPTNSYYIASNLTAGQIYYWKVRAYNACGWGSWSPRWSFTTCATPVRPTPETPANGETGVSTSPLLDWSTMALANKYAVQVDTDTAFSSPIVIDQETGSSYYSATGLAGNTRYYWRVRSGNACGWSSWTSPVWSFTTANPCPTPVPPTRHAPVNGAQTVVQPLTFDWDTVATATQYKLQVDDDSLFASAAIDTILTIPDFVTSGLADSTKFYWRVQAYNTACDWGNWTSIWSFTTKKACPTPPAPVIIVPLNGDIVSVAPILLDWYTAGDSRYWIQLGKDSTFATTLINKDTLDVSRCYPNGIERGFNYFWRVRAHNACGWGDWTVKRRFYADVSSEVTETGHGTLPEAFALSQNHPNPFNPSTAIEFQLPRSSFVTLEIYDILGRQVTSLVSEFLSPGYKQVVWDGRDAAGLQVSSGVYLYRLTTDRFVETKKMLMLK